jgi:hypothetical protein
MEYRSSFTDSVPTAAASKRPRSNSYGFLNRSQTLPDYAHSSSNESDRTIVPMRESQITLHIPGTGIQDSSRLLRPQSITSLYGTPPEYINEPHPQRNLVLLVEDNPVNMKASIRPFIIAQKLTCEQILVNHMKRAQETQVSAINGLEALHKYQASHESIKVIFMGVFQSLFCEDVSLIYLRHIHAYHGRCRVYDSNPEV